MNVLMEYQNLFPPNRYNMDQLSKWKHPRLVHHTGDRLSVPLKSGRMVPFCELLTVDQFFDGVEEDTSDMITVDLTPSTTTFTNANVTFLLNSSSYTFYTRYFVLKRFLEVFNAIATSLEYIKMKSKSLSCIDSDRVLKFFLPEGGIETITNIISFLYPLIQILDFCSDPRSTQSETVSIIVDYMAFLKSETFSCITQDDLQRIILARGTIYNPIPTVLLSIIEDLQQKYTIPSNNVISPEVDLALNEARYEAYGIFHGSYMNYENPQTESEVEHRTHANKVKEELIGFIKSYVDRIGVNVDRYLDHSQFHLLNSIVKRVRGKASNHVEKNFFSFKKEELQLCMSENNQVDAMFLRIKGSLSCLQSCHTIQKDDEMIKRLIRYIQAYSRLKANGTQDYPFFVFYFC